MYKYIIADNSTQNYGLYLLTTALQKNFIRMIEVIRIGWAGCVLIRERREGHKTF